MIRAVRVYLGPDWLPSWLEVGYARERSHRRAETELGVRIACQTSVYAGLVFPAGALDVKRRHESRAWRLSDLKRMVGERTPSSSAEVVQRLMLFGVPDHDLSAPNIARLLGVSKRTLQRALEAEGTGFSKVLASARYAEARRLLDQSQMSIARLATHLGYGFEGNFIRAFQTWSGMSPTEFRLRTP